MAAIPLAEQKSILLTALGIRSTQERQAYLNAACGDNASLRSDIEALLRAHDQSGGRLDATDDLDRTQARTGIAEGPGCVVDRYKLLQQIGEGSFGLVFMAEQLEPVRRQVALKILKPGRDTQEVIARFESERQALALMEHPSIARVLDAGATQSGRPYFVMELVRGIQITDYCDRNRLSVRGRLELFIAVCQAVQHAHQKGVIHRDLKPSNILVTLRDGTPVVKVIDFGIAKAIDGRLTDRTLFTRYADVIGTPLYMSPEQAAMSELGVDTRTDIYSLGVLLYELLTGTTPHDRARMGRAACDEMRRILREEEPVKPSTKVGTLGEQTTVVSECRAVEPAELSALLKGDLDWIVMKALEKDRTRRYETASAFAKDVRRQMNDEPVEARPPTVSYRVRKFVRRNKTLVATIALLFVGMLMTSVVSVILTLYLAGAARDLQSQNTGLTETLILEKDRLAWSQQESGEHAAAIQTYRELLKIEQEHYGSDNLNTLMTSYRLATLLAAQNDLDEALEYAWPAYLGLKRQLPAEDHRRWQARHTYFDTSRRWLQGLWDVTEDRVVNIDEARRQAQRWSAEPAYESAAPLFLALIEYRCGNNPEGLAILEANLRGGYHRCYYWGLLAAFHSKLEQRESARDWYQAALEAWSLTSLSEDATTDESIFVSHARKLFHDVGLTESIPKAEQDPAYFVQLYDRLLAKHPDVDALYTRRAICHALLGDWNAAATDFERAFRLAPADFDHRFHWAVVCLQTGDLAGYQEACAALIEEWGRVGNPFDLGAAVVACTLAPEAGVERQDVLAIADWLEYERQRQDVALVSKGVALYRLGEWERAVSYLADVRGNTRDRGLAQSFLAMAHHHLGNVQQGMKCLDKAREIYRQEVPVWSVPSEFDFLERPLLEIMLRTALNEAEAVINANGP